MPSKAKSTAPKPSGACMTFAEAMAFLEKSGSAQTRKTYLRHGASEPLFGVSFATLKTLVKKIGVDHQLAIGLWNSGNFDARNLAAKIADPARMSEKDLDRWARSDGGRMCTGYVALLASEGPHASSRAKGWLGSKNEVEKTVGWKLVGSMAMCDEEAGDDWFQARIAEIVSTIHTAPNAVRESMNLALIQIGCRNAKLRKSAIAAAKKIGKVDVDHGDTACKTPDAVEYIDKSWSHSTSKGFESPAAHERSREPMRLRC